MGNLLCTHQNRPQARVHREATRQLKRLITEMNCYFSQASTERAKLKEDLDTFCITCDMLTTTATVQQLFSIIEEFRTSNINPIAITVSSADDPPIEFQIEETETVPSIKPCCALPSQDAAIKDDAGKGDSTRNKRGLKLSINCDPFNDAMSTVVASNAAPQSTAKSYNLSLLKICLTETTSQGRLLDLIVTRFIESYCPEAASPSNLWNTFSIIDLDLLWKAQQFELSKVVDKLAQLTKRLEELSGRKRRILAHFESEQYFNLSGLSHKWAIFANNCRAFESDFDKLEEQSKLEIGLLKSKLFKAKIMFNHMLDTFDYDSKSKNEDDKVKDFFNEWIAFVSEFKEAFHRKVVLTVSGK